ncbi:MAG: tubulin-like doman-containing protein [Treponema sp.]|jgi:hypothetical protein|nr:tubulin-like doman-containing protein [Treponema sp.]
MGNTGARKDAPLNNTRENYYNKIEEALFGGNNPFELCEDVLVLIIGLGGTGMRFVAETKKLFTKRYGAETLAKTVTFRCIDTDAATLNDPAYSIFEDNEKIPINGFTRTRWIDGWLSETTKKADFGTGRDGAGGIRPCGRWQLFSTERSLTNDFKAIFEGYGSRQDETSLISRVYIIEIASIYGGTGCGTFIDVPYIVRHAMEKADFTVHTEFYGMLVTPDAVHFNNDEDKKQAYANGYAALKELQYFMRNDCEYSASFGEKQEMWEAGGKTERKIFKQVFLLSNRAIKPTERQQINRGYSFDKTMYLDGAIPEAINIMISRPKRGENERVNGIFRGFASKMSDINARTNDADIERGLFVATFGATKSEIPLAEFIIAIFNRLFLDLKFYWDELNNREKIDNLADRKIAAAFNVSGLYDEIVSRLDFGGINFDSSEVNELIRKRLDTVVSDLNSSDAAFIERMKGVVDGIYRAYGPFVVSKVLEDDVYKEKLDGKIKQVKEERLLQFRESIKANNKSAVTGDPVSPQEIRQAFKKRNSGLGKDARQKSRQKYVGMLNCQDKVFKKLEEIVSNRQKKVETEIHQNIYDRVTEMMHNKKTNEGLIPLLEGITGIKTKDKFRNTGNGETWTWDSSEVEYDKVHKKVDLMFSRKLVLKNKKEIVMKEPVFRIEGGVKKEEILFWPSDAGPVDVLIGNDEEKHSVVSVDEMFCLNGAAAAPLPIHNMLMDFLEDVKNNKNDGIFDLLVKHFTEIINQFTRQSFVDLMVMNSDRWDFSWSIADMPESEKLEIFKDAVTRFKLRGLPSFFVADDHAQDLFTDSLFSILLQPSFEEPYQTILQTDNTEQIVKWGNTVPLERDHLNSMMISVNFYFKYGLDWFRILNECRDEYNERIKAVSMHLADGGKENWLAEGKLKDIGG